MPATALTIGTFDGVHRGHAALVAAARSAAGPTGRVVVAAFDPHPMAVLRPGHAPARLSSAAQKKRWLLETGADEVTILTPERALLSLGPREFLEAFLHQHPATTIVEGPDFRFGRDRAGDIDGLRRLGRTLGFEVTIIEPVEATLTDHTVVPLRSTMVRWLLRHGRVRDAARLLGRPYELESRVVRGEQRGRTIGCPTANLEHLDALLPADGVYAGTATLPDGATRAAAISVGTKPTFGEFERLCEVHLIDHDGRLDEYGWTLRVTFERWLRDQMAFSGVEPLLRQMQRDVANAREIP